MKSFFFVLFFANTLFFASTPLSLYGQQIPVQWIEESNLPLDPIEFLQNLASIEPKDEGAEQLDHSAAKSLLNGMQEEILATNDLNLISLYQRAVRNFNSFSPIKANPTTTYYKHYQEPSFSIPDIALTFDVHEESLGVITKLTIHRMKDNVPLILDGRDHQVDRVIINGKTVPRGQYRVTYHELILLNTPEDEQFTVEVHSQINPFVNTSLEGMYVCRECLTTQCESEGARKIFFTLDRPDVLSRITTTIIADSSKYPHRLSNGNLIHESAQDDSREAITWEDPIPKPSYLFACVLGNFSLLTDRYTTRSGKEVELQTYVEPGKESRAKYSLTALKKAMEFDELFFDREYDLSCLKMVGIPDFNSGAMENKGLMIFNETSLLVDSEAGTDAAFRRVATVIGHEYFHNWSGNRVTIRNWFEIALKEAFTDWRAIRFAEWLFGEEFIRPKDVNALRALQFPEEYSEKGHPIMVENYVDAHSIYDHTTYTKGREVFRSFQIYVDSLIPGGFREALNIYFAKNDGKAVTFRELLSAADEVLARVGKDSSQFERWFFQPGTPVVKVEMIDRSEDGTVEFIVTQSCPHPKTGAKQDPFVIPFSLELLGEDGVICKKINLIFDQETTHFSFAVDETPTPIFMHGYSAPVILNFDYSLDDLARIMKYSDDAFSRWEASQKYAIKIIQEMMSETNEVREDYFHALLTAYSSVLRNNSHSPIAKAQLLEIPSVRSISQALNDYDFATIARFQSLYQKQLASTCQPALEELLNQYPSSTRYEPTAEQMQIRELRTTCLSLLALIDEDYHETVYQQYEKASNFNDKMTAYYTSIYTRSSYKDRVIKDFYEKWKDDPAVFNYWLSVQACVPEITVGQLIELTKVKGYNKNNPNHIRSVVLTFVMNLGCYHDPEGKGYAYVVDKILEVGMFNPQLAHNYLFVPAFQDIDHLPERQRKLMLKELKRLQNEAVAPQTRDFVEKILLR